MPAQRRCSRRISLTPSLSFLTRIQPEERHDNRQQDNLPKDKHCRIETPEFVLRIVVNDEGAEGNTRHQPDDLSLGVPHRVRAWSLELCTLKMLSWRGVLIQVDPH